jgi:hypothetical protein
MTERKLRVSDWVSPVLIIAAVLFLLSFATSAFAQSSSGGVGVLTGTVVDASDKKPQSDVVVTATSPALQGEQVVVTDSSGFYRIPDLPSGDYSLRFEKDSFKPYERGGIALRSDTTLRVNAELLPTTLKSEEIVVVAKAPTVDVGSSSTGANITSDFTRRVPVSPPTAKGSANRSFESVAEVTPGAQADTYGVSISGASSPENGYLIDGTSVGNPSNGTIGTPLSSEFVKEVTVISGGYLPEYGRTMGGVLNAVTKTGSNEFHGGVFSYYAPGGLAGSPKIATPPVSAVRGSTPLNYTWDIGGDIGGPIIKDKLWFYFGFDYSTESYHVNRTFWVESLDATGNVVNDAHGNPVLTQIPGTDQSYLATARTLQGIAKLTYAIDDNNRLSATFIGSPTTTGGTGQFSVSSLTGGPETDGTTGTYSATAHQLNSASYDSQLKWSTEFDNKRFLVDSVVGWHHQYNDILPSDGTLPGSGQGLSSFPSVNWNYTNSIGGLPTFEGHQFDTPCRSSNPTGVPTLCPLPSYFSGGPSGRVEQQTFDRYTVGSTLTHLFQGLGHHVAKAGFSVEYTSWDHLKSHAGGAAILEGGSGGLGDTEHFGALIGPDNPSFAEPFRLKTNSIIAGGFVQDSWSVMDVVTLNVGLRYDIQTMYSASGQLGLTMPNEWSPRVGVIYDPTQEGRAKLFGNFARYYENVPLGLADGSLSGEPSVLATYGANCTPTQVGQTNGCQSNTYRVPGIGAANASNPSRRWAQFGAGADAIDPNLSPTSTDEFVFGGEYEVFKDARAGLAYTHRYINRWIEDMSIDNRQTFFIGNPGYGIASGFPAAERNYDALTMYLMKTFGDDWLTSASYTISYLRGNIGGLFASNAELDPNHNYDFDTKSIMFNSSGPLPGDHTHDIKVFGAKDWRISAEHGFSTGLAFRAKSGGPIDFRGADPTYGPGIDLLLPRGSGGRLPWNYDVDANLAYRFSLDKDKTVTFSVDIFNLFNFQEVTAVDDNYTLQSAIGKNGGTLRDVTVYPGSPAPPRPLYISDKNPNYGSAMSFQSPRYFRFGIRGTF